LLKGKAEIIVHGQRAGAVEVGYLLKDTKSEKLVEAIRQMHRGEPSLHPGIARKLLQEVSQSRPPKPTPEPLTERELEVPGLLARGLDNQQIAEVTVRSHVSHILASCTWPTGYRKRYSPLRGAGAPGV
jgi:NarL family two-component system response regulator LiaR